MGIVRSAIASRLKAIESRLEAIAFRLEAIATVLEAEKKEKEESQIPKTLHCSKGGLYTFKGYCRVEFQFWFSFWCYFVFIMFFVEFFSFCSPLL